MYEPGQPRLKSIFGIEITDFPHVYKNEEKVLASVGSPRFKNSRRSLTVWRGAAY